MEHNVGICKRTQCETTENERVLTSVYGPLSSVSLEVVFLLFGKLFDRNHVLYFTAYREDFVIGTKNTAYTTHKKKRRKRKTKTE